MYRIDTAKAKLQRSETDSEIALNPSQKDTLMLTVTQKQAGKRAQKRGGMMSNNTEMTPERRLIAADIINRGPAWGECIASRLNLTLEAFFTAICCGWFVLDTGGYRLSKRGNVIFADLKPGADGATGGAPEN